VAERFLKQFGFEVYLPRVWQRWHRFGRRIQVRAPYFPGYCFTRIELQWHNVKQCPGVIRVGQGRRPAARRLRTLVGHSGLCTQVSRQQVGVLLLMFKAQRQVKLRRDAVELV
jgi:hypothetical protein